VQQLPCTTIYRLKSSLAHRLPRIGFDGVAIVGVLAFAGVTLWNAKYETDIGDAQSAKEASSSLMNKKLISRDLARDLDLKGFAVIENVLLPEELAAARTSSLNILSEGRMHYAGGNSISVRQDRVCFVRGSDGTPQAIDEASQAYNPVGSGLQHCISLLRGVTLQLQELGFSRSINHRVPTQCQLAHYTGNGNTSHVAHRDAASDTNFYEVSLLAW